MTSIQHNDPDETIQPLAEDNDPPFSLPDSPVGDGDNQTFDRKINDQKLDPTHPDTDSESDLDLQEQYDAGEAAAANSSEPNAGNDVVGYDPENDSRKR